MLLTAAILLHFFLCSLSSLCFQAKPLLSIGSFSHPIINLVPYLIFSLIPQNHPDLKLEHYLFWWRPLCGRDKIPPASSPLPHSGLLRLFGSHLSLRQRFAHEFLSSRPMTDLFPPRLRLLFWFFKSSGLRTFLCPCPCHALHPCNSILTHPFGCHLHRSILHMVWVSYAYA